LVSLAVWVMVVFGFSLGWTHEEVVVSCPGHGFEDM